MKDSSSANSTKGHDDDNDDERDNDNHDYGGDDDDDGVDVLWNFRDTDQVEETPKPTIVTKTGVKKFPKYQIRHQSLAPSEEDAKHFSVDKDQLGR